MSLWEHVRAHAVAGGLAGLVADGIMYPVDTVKARMQVQRVSERKYRSLLHAAKVILREEGARRGLYSGLGAVLTGSIPTHAIIFSVYHGLKSGSVTMASPVSSPASSTWTAADPLQSQYADSSSLEPSNVLSSSSSSDLATDFAAGAVAEVLALAVYVPSEVVAKRMQVAKLGPGRNYSSSWDALKIIYRREGWRGLYAGTLPTTMRDVPFTAMQLMIFDCLKRLWTATSSTTWGNTQSACAGFIAGAAAAAATNPFDVVKTRIQTQATGSERKYQGVWHGARRIVREEGIRALGNGTTARVLWVAPASAITLAVYESAFEFMTQSSNNSEKRAMVDTA